MKQYFLILLAFTAIFSCKKADNIGGDILPNSDYLNLELSDTFLLTSKTIAESPVRTDKLIFNYIGVLQSAEYGKNHAKLMFELANPTIALADSLAPYTIDSAVLFMKYNIVYGDTNSTQNIVVKTLNDNILENQKYYSDNAIFFGTNEVGRANNIALKPSQKFFTYTGDTLGSVSIIRVPMEASYAQTYVDKIGSSDSALIKYANFDNYFRGLEVAFENNLGNAMALVDLTSDKTRFTIFLKDKNGVRKEMNMYPRLTSVVKESTTYLQSSAINVYGNTYNSSVNNALSSTELTDSINFIIGQAGLMNKITIPDFSNLINQQAAVNKAELYVTQTNSNADTSSNVSIIYALYKDNSGNFKISGIGAKDSVYVNGNNEKVARYNINISTIVKEMWLGRLTTRDIYLSNHNINQNTDAELNDISYLGGYAPTKLTIGGTNSSDIYQKTRLKIFYSKQ
ncbi:MAG TPA: DUF4270 family protein [Chitinophagales bacterium]|nr:DUF4270 domain-containing protein [Chitinophagales bacterium]HMU98606.1 DUF4270 family protein [Chitinophagales bacterium]HMV03054.1 DUF4270 family protein [Chitinophagales bacterium]HMW94905.1 DUF4270 family protein [Chitinophagales bacterium]HMY42838.1 DUF4270 family protein [Chitinophagales bacterium]